MPTLRSQLAAKNSRENKRIKLQPYEERIDELMGEIRAVRRTLIARAEKTDINLAPVDLDVEFERLRRQLKVPIEDYRDELEAESLHGFTHWQIASVGTKELNQRLKAYELDKTQTEDIKKLRRKIKNRIYASTVRARRQESVLEGVIKELMVILEDQLQLYLMILNQNRNQN